MTHSFCHHKHSFHGGTLPKLNKDTLKNGIMPKKMAIDSGPKGEKVSVECFFANAMNCLDVAIVAVGRRLSPV